uniref:Uncharacterized protein n=1 Tax=Arundo donax TaxID=35708 RepID=A0A0A8ZF88_ARUDO
MVCAFGFIKNPSGQPTLGIDLR